MPINYGRTIAYPTATGDITTDLRPVTGIDALVQSLFRRFETDEGTIPWDRGAGYNLLNFVLENEPDVRAIRKRVEAECKKDDRVDTVSALVTWNRRDKTLRVEIEGQGALGPFALAVKASELTLELLRS